MEKDPAKVLAGSLGGLAKGRNSSRAKAVVTVAEYIKVERLHAAMMIRQAEAITAFLDELEAGETP